MARETLKSFLDELYVRYNRSDLIHTDPVVHLHGYIDPADREVVGFVTAALAYGRVAQIIRSVTVALSKLGPSPAETVTSASAGELEECFRDFKHRFTTGREMAELLFGVGEILRSRGSLNACFLEGVRPGEPTVLPALTSFVETVRLEGGVGRNSLLPSPSDGSACKRLNLFLRWMVRRDDVDPGGWVGVSPSQLLVPLDVHMHRTARTLGLTSRRQADMKTVLEITERFRMIEPGDPVKYDFALTRPGIEGNGEWGRLKANLLKLFPTGSEKTIGMGDQ